jgi:ATP-dependent protease ClpP protease subunit
MKQAYYFDIDFAEEEVHKVLAFVNNLQPGDEVDFYIHSPGGFNHAMETIKSILENCGYPVTLIASGELASAAFLFFYFSTLNKIILPHAVAVLHAVSSEFEDRDARQNSNYYKKTRTRLNTMNDQIIEIFKTYNVLSEEDLEDYINGEDILLLTDELKAVMENCPYGTYREKIS